MPEDWVDLKEATKRLGYSDPSVLRHRIRTGSIPVEARRKFGSSWALRSDWLEREEFMRPGDDLVIDE